jgi:hypothetical protein
MASIPCIQEIDRTKAKHERTYKGSPTDDPAGWVRRLKDEEKFGASARDGAGERLPGAEGGSHEPIARTLLP